MSFINELETAFQKNGNPENAMAMAKYMKNNFPFFGIKTVERRRILKEIWKGNQQEVAENTREIALQLFAKQQRELHYCAVEILIKELKGKNTKEDARLIEKLILTNSWWDSVDFLAKYLLGNYLQQFPEETDALIGKFSASENIWLNRSAILFQLNYKTNTDADLLFAICREHSHSTEFFIQKAIGWALREYAKINPEAVTQFVASANLKPLSRKEAMKNLKQNW